MVGQTGRGGPSGSCSAGPWAPSWEVHSATVSTAVNLLEGSEELDPGARERIQTAFFTATFSVMGHMAKLDGRVSEREIAVAESVIARMELSPDMRRAAIRLFTEGKAGFPLDDIQDAYADGRPGPAKDRLLLYICEYMGISRHVFRHLEQLVRLQQAFTTGTRSDGRHMPQRPAAEGPTLAQAPTRSWKSRPRPRTRRSSAPTGICSASTTRTSSSPKDSRKR